MRDAIESQQKTKTGAGRKVLIVFGLLFLAIGVFLASFACSFQMMIESAEAAQADEASLENENEELREEVQLLQDQVDILEGELEKYKGTAKKATVKPAETSSGKSSNAEKPSQTPKTESASKSDTASNSNTTTKPAEEPAIFE